MIFFYVFNGGGKLRHKASWWLATIAMLIVAGIVAQVWVSHESVRVAQDMQLLSQSYGPPLPIPKPMTASPAQRKAVIEQVTRQGQDAERSVAAVQGASSPDATALHSWNAFFASAVRATQR